MTQFTDLLDVASERLGAAAIAANDEFFAPKEGLLKASAPEWREGVYTERGKWMDGWETRRRRTPGYDWCIVRLGVASRVHGVVVDTSFFRGNFPEACSIDACDVPAATPADVLATDASIAWSEMLPRSVLGGDARNEFAVSHERRASHLRLNIFPDGGVARLRVHGVPRPDAWVLEPGREIDLAAAENGAQVLACSDMFFGHRHNLIMPGRSTHMGDGWETKRRRGPGHDWSVVRLAARGVIARVEIDTDHFKGNAPESASLETWSGGASGSSAPPHDGEWMELLPRTVLQPHTRHLFRELAHDRAATHARLRIWPDGGIARLRLIGRIEAE